MWMRETTSISRQEKVFGVSAPVNDVCIDDDVLSANAGLTERLA